MCGYKVRGCGGSSGYIYKLYDMSQHMNKSSAIVCTALFVAVFISGVTGISSSVQDQMLEQWEEFSQKPESKQLIQWLRCQARAKLTGTVCGEQLKATLPSYFGRLGIFITLTKGKKVRGCYGAFSHTCTDIKELLLDYLSGALTRDARYEPLDTGELETTSIILSITSPPQAVTDLDSVDVHRYGISVNCGEGIVSVYVPAEIRSTEFLQKRVMGKECQISAFRAVTIR
jgi:AMMECR1 domain-containing protein